MDAKGLRGLTIKVCREHQCGAEYAAWKAREAVERGDHTMAIAYQASAWRYARDAMARLDALLGVDAIVEKR